MTEDISLPVLDTTQPMFVLEVIEDRSTSLETCDACGPAVYAACRVILGNGGVLTFCGHHGARWGYVHTTEDSKLKGSDH
jgi:hypothetical protein